MLRFPSKRVIVAPGEATAGTRWVNEPVNDRRNVSPGPGIQLEAPWFPSFGLNDISVLVQTNTLFETKQPSWTYATDSPRPIPQSKKTTASRGTATSRPLSTMLITDHDVACIGDGAGWPCPDGGGSMTDSPFFVADWEWASGAPTPNAPNNPTASSTRHVCTFEVWQRNPSDVEGCGVTDRWNAQRTMSFSFLP